MAQSGQAGLTSIGENVSINDSGVVAFTGAAAYGPAAFIAGGPGGVTQVTVGAGGNLGQYVQINNSGNVATIRGPDILTTDPIYEYVPYLGWILISPGYTDSLYFFQLFNAAGPQLIDTFESADARVVDYGNYGNLGGPFSYLGPAVTVNNNNQAAFVGDEGVGFNDYYVLATPIDGSSVNAVPIPLIAQPMIADDGSIVCQNGAGATAPIVRFNYTLTTAEIIASAAQGFSALGLAPGISDDGTYIAFYGVTALSTDGQSGGPGIYLSYVGPQGGVIQQVAGLASGFNSFQANMRVGVNTQPDGTALVVYGATDSGGNLGIYATFFSQTTGTPGPPIPVVRVGDSIGASGNLQSFNLYDPVNQQGQVAFWAQTDSGQAVVVSGPTGGTLSVFDANPQYLASIVLPQPTTPTLLATLATASTVRDTAAADGVTKLLLEFTSTAAGTVNFDQSGAPGGTLLNLDGTLLDSTDVHTTSVGGQQMAFALYTVPETITPGQTTITLKSSFTPDGSPNPIQQIPVNLRLIQTPVVLVHGLWDKGEVWINLQYYMSTLKITAQLVKYWDNDYKASGPFIHYSGVVTDQIKTMLKQMRAGVPNSKTGAAVTVADVVAHSMGGILTRQDANNPAGHKADNFNNGYIRRIISVDTPYWGATPAPTLSLLAADSPVFNFVLSFNQHPVDKGGVRDLSPRSFAVNSGGSTSFVYKALTNPCCAISCYVDQNGDFSSDLGQLYEATAFTYIHLSQSQANDITSLLCGNYIGTGLDNMGMANNLFNFNRNDGIVALSSQKGGYTGPPSTFAGIEHTTAPANPQIGTYIVGLLQGPVSAFGNGLPVVSQAALSSQMCTPAPPEIGFPSKSPRLPLSPQAQAPLISLTAPLNGSAIHAGASITVVVQPATNIILEGVIVMTSDDSPFSAQNAFFDIITNSPYSKVITAPTNFFGPLSISAIGVDNHGNYDIEQCTVEIVPSTNLTLQSISARFNSVGTSLTFSELGVPQALDVIGTYSDGGARDISFAGSGTIYSTGSVSVASVDTNGNVTAVGNGSAMITISNQGVSIQVPVQVDLQPPEVISIQPNYLLPGSSNITVTITGTDLGGTTNVVFLRNGQIDTNLTVGTLVIGANTANIQVPVSVSSNARPGALTAVCATPIGNSSQTAEVGSQIFIVSSIAPVIQAVGLSGNSVSIIWSALPNQDYQIQSATNLMQTNWTTLSGTITATNSTASISEPIGTNIQQFYRVLLLP